MKHQQVLAGPRILCVLCHAYTIRCCMLYP